jgi:hypothetical protein
MKERRGEERRGKVSLRLTKHHTMKAYWEWRYSPTHSLISALDEVSDQLHALATLSLG